MARNASDVVVLVVDRRNVVINGDKVTVAPNAEVLGSFGQTSGVARVDRMTEDGKAKLIRIFHMATTLFS